MRWMSWRCAICESSEYHYFWKLNESTFGFHEGEEKAPRILFKTIRRLHTLLNLLIYLITQVVTFFSDFLAGCVLLENL